MKYLDKIVVTLRNSTNPTRLLLHINVENNSLSKKWLSALNHLLTNGHHLEKNYCFHGFADGPRDGNLILNKVNQSIAAINQANIGYTINDYFSLDNTITDQPDGEHVLGRNIIHSRMNWLHRYFEDLQGVSGNMSPYYHKADAGTKWHIRQLNLLCHEFESWALSWRKQIEAPDWQRPSQLMCWLNAPRFELDENDYELFGINSLLRGMGEVFVGVNKAVGKHHWEVFCDEGRDSRIGELITSTLKSQTEAAGDFDIEWGRNTRNFDWKQQELDVFRQWLVANGFDPEDKSLTIGHPRVAHVDLLKSFGTTNHQDIWKQLNNFQDVYQITTSEATAVYDYRWTDADFQQRQIDIISQGH